MQIFKLVYRSTSVLSTSLINGCNNANLGVNLNFWSQLKQPTMKSTNIICSDFIASITRSLQVSRDQLFPSEPIGGRFPLKNVLILGEFPTKDSGGGPRISIIWRSWPPSSSSYPGKRGCPVWSSASIQPTDQPHVYGPSIHHSKDDFRGTIG